MLITVHLSKMKEHFSETDTEKELLDQIRSEAINKLINIIN